MFFIGIFGIEAKEKVIGSLPNFACKSCTSNNAKIIKHYNYFHFFFIPVFKWGEEYIVLCDECNSIYSIPKEKGKAFELGKEEISYWDLKPLQIKNLSFTCPSCGKETESSFDFCPYCGNTLNK